MEKEKIIKEEIDLILQQGEGLKIEFKESFNAKAIAKEITAFANTEGGRIILGINDQKEVIGINVTNKLKSEIQDIARKCDPFIKIKTESFGNILIINVFEGKNKPYQCSSGFYIREGPNSQKLSRDEIIKFITGIGKIKFDELFNENFKFPEDFDDNKFNEFLKKSNISKNNSIKNILINLSLAEKFGKKLEINNAGILLFGKNIKRFIRNNGVDCVLFKGEDRVNIIDRKEFDEDLFSNYENALKFLKQHLRVEYIIKGGGPRQELLEIPEEALKEALINSIIHRDYFETGMNVSINIFDNRVEITNFGKLFFDKRKLGKVSFSRNPVLFDMFHRRNLIEKVGSGIGRIKKLLKERNLKVRFETNNIFRIVLERPLIKGVGGILDKDEVYISEKTKERVDARLTQGLREVNARFTQELYDKEKKILAFIIQNEKIKSNDCERFLGISRVTANKHFKSLMKKGLITKKGRGKYTYYILKNDETKKR